MTRAILLVAAMLLSLAASRSHAAPAASTSKPATPLLALHAKGREIRDAHGKVLQLRGVNIGGWLVTESWMCGQTDDVKRKALEQLEARFGNAKAATLMDAWQDHWFTAADFDLIASWGFNVVRVPFSYRTLQDAQGNWRRDAKHNIDFSRMDWLVREAERRGVYVVFDLHVWPGAYEVISRPTPEGKEARDKMSLLWAEVAKHYRGVAVIAAFDIINEPEGSPGNILHHAFYNAIRAQDASRMLVLENLAYPSLKTERWTNIVWSSHYPEDAQKTGTVAERIAKFDEREKISATPAVQVPIFIGEIKATEDNADSAAALAKALNDRGWHWTVWTYKGVDNGGWAAFNYDASVKYNLATDTYEDILEKWTKRLSQWQSPDQPVNYRKTDWWIEGFTRKP